MSSTTSKSVHWSDTVKVSVLIKHPSVVRLIQVDSVEEEVEAERKRSREVAIEALEATPRPNWACYTMVYGYPVTTEWIKKAAKEKGVKTDSFGGCADCIRHILRRKSRINELQLCAPNMYARPSNPDDWLIAFGADYHLKEKGRWPTLAQIQKPPSEDVDMEAERRRSREVAIAALEATESLSGTIPWAAKEEGAKTDRFGIAADYVLRILRRKSGFRELEVCAPRIYANINPNSEDWLITFGTARHLANKGRWPTLAAIEKVRRMIRPKGKPMWVPVWGAREYGQCQQYRFDGLRMVFEIVFELWYHCYRINSNEDAPSISLP
ncbi:hypothetical protein GLOTRDRAFT_90588 [Gloeophyllum trabeum ATCC 11539]|uniref:Uncharacterized protein n=1 Tax=Gloeophyllum trabeum (strain ATCC 11539 / FP-39264 / Madison 617) TaxID=670483 RepID=S7QHT2_GLOTA|nr:uncharacterized protein GLOTRDRAFT_90588 [Gloeophyllum trabeum ATCC 11539]EPQ58798.1 hypothetical protein GLOTRDRAFT_90588 [Gloeophyllum trabeum ATCC 11539]